MPAKQKELLAQAQASMAKIKATKLPKLQVLPDISREEMASWSTAEVGYRDELASRLQILLRLPEFGEVKIKLTLARSGRVIKLDILSAESSVNRKYIEKTLPTLTFPPFDRNFESKDEHTFSITLRGSN